MSGGNSAGFEGKVKGRGRGREGWVGDVEVSFSGD